MDARVSPGTSFFRLENQVPHPNDPKLRSFIPVDATQAQPNNYDMELDVGLRARRR